MQWRFNAIITPMLFFISVLIIALLGFIAFRFARLTQTLRTSEERWKFALEGAGDGVWDWDIQNDKVELSPRYIEMYGFTNEDVKRGMVAWVERIQHDDRARVEADVKDYLAGKTAHYINEHRVLCKDGQVKWALSRGMVVSRDKTGKPLRMIGTHADITDRKNMEEQLRRMAQFDVLTQLPNRVLIGDRLKQAMALAKREKSQLALMFLDLDKFKPVNDTLGHEVGDLLLKQVAERLQLSIRASDTVARIGGDEFVVLLPVIETSHDVAVVAEKILAALNQTFQIGSHTIHISSSIGIAIYPQHGSSEKELMINADTAMYYAKKEGRNNAQTYHAKMLEQNVK
jgi:diguanylate cyclase (GGDEF)-like protein/PAS domain S-box-containing protein